MLAAGGPKVVAGFERPVGWPSPLLNLSLPMLPDTSSASASALPPKAAEPRWLKPVNEPWNGVADCEAVTLTVDPTNLRLLIPFAWIAVLPVVPTIGKRNWA